jgi:hypothetical protein
VSNGKYKSLDEARRRNGIRGGSTLSNKDGFQSVENSRKKGIHNGVFRAILFMCLSWNMGAIPNEEEL